MKRSVVLFALLLALSVSFVGLRRHSTSGAVVVSESDGRRQSAESASQPLRFGSSRPRRASFPRGGANGERRLIQPGAEFWKRPDAVAGAVVLADVPERVANRFESVDDISRVEGRAFSTETRGAVVVLGGSESAGELKLSTSAVTVDGRVLPVEKDRGFQPLGNTVQATLNNAISVDEHVEVLDEGVEWTWILNRPMSGDVAIDLRLDGAGDAIVEEDGGWLVENITNGSWIRIGRSLLVDAAGRTVALATGYSAGMIHVEVPAEVLAAAAFPVAIDPIINPGVDVEVTRNAAPGRIPSIAGNGDNYLVVWEDSRNDALSRSDVYATRVSETGVILDADGIEISRGPGDQVDPCVTSDGDGYLVVWSDARSSASSRSIYGTLVSGSGEVADSQGTLIGGGEKPAAAFNGEHYMVVWQSAGSSTASIRARRVGTDGGLLDDSRISVASGADKNGVPAIASDGIDFLIVWAAMSNGSLDVFGHRIAGTDGLIFEEDPIVISDAERDQSLPDVAGRGGGYLVVWQDFRIGLDVFGARVDGDTGQVLDPAGFAINSADGSQFNAAVVSDDDGYVVTWQDTRRGQSDVFLTPVSPDGVAESLEGMRVNRTANVSVGPAIAGSGDGFLVVYQKVTSNSELSILGQRYSGYEPTAIGFSVESASWLEGDGPIVLDASATFTVPGTSLIRDGRLEVQVVDPVSGDLLELPSSEGGVEVDDQIVLVGGMEVGTLEQISPASTLAVVFNSDADPTAVEAVLRHVHFHSDAAAPETGERIVEAVFTDGSGVESSAARISVVVTDADSIPSIAKQPMGGSVSEGGEFTLSVEAEWGGTGDLSYQWQFEGVDLPGAVLPTILLTNLQLEESGAYRVVVGSSAASTVSEEAVIEVHEVTSFVSRTLPSGYGPGMLLSVSLEVQPPSGTEVFAVEDSPPAGWTIVDAGDGSYDSGSGKIKFGPWFGDAAATFSYTVRVPGDAEGEAVFGGVGSADGLRSPVVGDESIGAGAAHPADLSPENGVLNIEEVSAYSLAWRKGESWPVEPTEIPIAYVTRAGLIWKDGEAYAFDYSITNAPIWWTSTTEGGAEVGAAEAVRPTISVSLEPSGESGDVYDVVIKVAPVSDTKAWAVEDMPPAGWEISAIPGGGVIDASNGRIKWGPFFDSKARTIGYTLTRTPVADAEMDFAGVVSVDGTEFDLRSSPMMGEPVAVAAIARLSEGTFEVAFTGESGRSYRVEASTDLALWSEVTTVLSSGGESVFADAEFADHPSRFYRVVPVP